MNFFSAGGESLASRSSGGTDAFMLRQKERRELAVNDK